MRSNGAPTYYPKVFDELGDPKRQFTILALIKHRMGHEPQSLVSKSCILKINPSTQTSSPGLLFNYNSSYNKSYMLD